MLSVVDAYLFVCDQIMSIKRLLSKFLWKIATIDLLDCEDSASTDVTG